MSKTAKGIKNFVVVTIIYILGILYFFPLLYMFLTSFKSEYDVIPPSIFFKPTLENYASVLSGDIGIYISNSVIVTVAATVLALVLGVPAAYALVYGKLRKSNNIFFWFISTTLLPPVGIIIPMFLVFKFTNLLDRHIGLIIVYAAINTPIVIWMVRSFLAEIPKEIIEASYIDGSSERYTFFHIILPLIKTGITSATLLVIIFIWNEFFFAVNLTYTNAATIPVYMASFMTQEGLFWAKLSAISTLAILPPLILGWISQKALVRGLTMGAIKG